MERDSAQLTKQRSGSTESRAVTNALNESVESTPIDLGQLVRSVAKRIAADYPEADIAVRGFTELSVTSTLSLDSVLEELFTNAVIHNDSDEPRLRIELSADEEYATVTMRDNGPGISEFDKDVLESGGAIEKLSHGSGLGLWLVYWAIKRSGGNIRVDCKPKGTEINIKLLLADDS